MFITRELAILVKKNAEDQNKRKKNSNETALAFLNFKTEVAHTRPEQIQARQSPSTEKVSTKPYPQARRYLQLISDGKVEVSIAILTTIQGRSQAQEQLVNRKWTPVFCFV